MKYVVKGKHKGNHYVRKRVNRKKVFITVVVCIALLIFVISMINKQNEPVAQVQNEEQNVIIVDKSGENDTQQENSNDTKIQNTAQNNEQANNEQNNGQTNQQETEGNQQSVGQSDPPQDVVIPNNFSALTADELQRFDKIYSHSDPKRIFLTFDDGPTTQVTPYILDLLKSENIKATFFVLGNRVDANPALVKREFEEGHYIANHGYTHSYKSIYQSSNSVIDEYNKTNQAIRNAIGKQDYNSLVFRFPGGSVGGTYDSIKKATKQLLRERGIASVDWNALSGDAEGIKTTDGLYNRFVQTASSYTSVVVLMHDAADKILTYETLPRIIEYCRNNGYEFKTMYDLLLRD